MMSQVPAIKPWSPTVLVDLSASSSIGSDGNDGASPSQAPGSCCPGTVVQALSVELLSQHADLGVDALRVGATADTPMACRRRTFLPACCLPCSLPAAFVVNLQASCPLSIPSDAPRTAPKPHLIVCSQCSCCNHLNRDSLTVITGWDRLSHSGAAAVELWEQPHRVRTNRVNEAATGLLYATCVLL